VSLEGSILEMDLAAELSNLRSNLQYVEDFVKQKRYSQAVTYARAAVSNLVRVVEICAELRGTETR
jgi:hypothetical protein